MQIPEFSKAMLVLQLGTGKTLTGAQVEVWFQCLKDLPLEALQKAITKYLCEGDDWPSISKIRKLAAGMTDKSRALLAWDAFMEANRKQGGSITVDFEDTIINATVRSLGGWQEVTLLYGDELHKWLRMRFLSTYEELGKAPLSSEMTQPLIGELEANNHFGGSPEPVRIACQSAPKQRPLVEGEVQKKLPSAVRELAESFSVENSR